MSSLAALEVRLYREMRSCLFALEGAAFVEAGCVAGVVPVTVEGRAIWGWKDGGG